MAEPSGPVTPGNGHPIVRDRLGALRDDLLRQLAEADHLDAGLLATLAHVETVLARLDRDAGTEAPPMVAEQVRA